MKSLKDSYYNDIDEGVLFGNAFKYMKDKDEAELKPEHGKSKVSTKEEIVIEPEAKIVKQPSEISDEVVKPTPKQIEPTSKDKKLEETLSKWFK